MSVRVSSNVQQFTSIFSAVVNLIYIAEPLLYCHAEATVTMYSRVCRRHAGITLHQSSAMVVFSVLTEFIPGDIFVHHQLSGTYAACITICYLNKSTSVQKVAKCLIIEKIGIQISSGIGCVC